MTDKPAVVVVGGGIAGLAAALALGERGHRVQVLERSAAPPEGPAALAGERWLRSSVPQAEHPHMLTSVGVGVLRERAPALWHDVLAAGAVPLDLLAALPPAATHCEPEPGDEALVALACRRKTLEVLLFRRAAAQPTVRVRHGVTARGLAIDAERRVSGVLLDDGSRIPADVVLDATGRRAAGRDWLAAAGIQLDADQVAPSGFRGFSRFYQLNGRDWPGPLNRGNAAGVVADHYAAVAHPGDNGTFSIILAVLPEDAAMRDLRHETVFTAAARATAITAPWMADGVAEPITPVRAINCPPNTLRALAVTDRPPVAGLYPVGDAACVTDPLYGRGMSLAFAHAYALADLLLARPRVDEGQARAAALLADRLFRPWYQQAAADDAARIALWRSVVHGTPVEAVGRVDGRPALAEISAAARVDGLVWRGLIRSFMGLTPPEDVFDDAEFRDRVRRARPPQLPGVPALDRDSLLHTVRTALAGELIHEH